jgi:hypothetical protein
MNRGLFSGKWNKGIPGLDNHKILRGKCTRKSVL